MEIFYCNENTEKNKETSEKKRKKLVHFRSMLMYIYKLCSYFYNSWWNPSKFVKTQKVLNCVRKFKIKKNHLVTSTLNYIHLCKGFVELEVNWLKSTMPS